MLSPTSPPFSLASDFCSDPRWSMAAAAMTPRESDTAFMPASLPGVIFTGISCAGGAAAALIVTDRRRMRLRHR